MKTCPKCGISKTLDNFYVAAHRTGGYYSYCKPCARAMTQNWVNKNREKKRAHRRAGATNLEASPAYSRKRRHSRHSDAGGVNEHQ